MTYIPFTAPERRHMLDAIGVPDEEALFAAIPQALRAPHLHLPEAHTEIDVEHKLQSLARRNTPVDERSFLGAGAYQRMIPAAVDAILSRSEFYTAYTPYQPEISQGTLQVIYEFQSLICQLTGLDVANASVYDGATALAEGAFLASRATRRQKLLVSAGVHPEYRATLATYAGGPGLAVIDIPLRDGRTHPDDVAALVDGDTAVVAIASPNFLGQIEELEQLADAAHAQGALFLTVTEPTSLGLFKRPGDLGADLVVGEAQSLGNSLSFGGPHVGFMACRENLVRQMPGRLAGMTVDGSGQRAFTLTLQTREQHIRREKATSNICSNQALNALAVTVYLSLLGPHGLREVAATSLTRAHYLAEKLAQVPGYRVLFGSGFYNEFVLQCPDPARTLAVLREEGILGGVPLAPWFPQWADCLLVAVTEVNDPECLDAYAAALERNTP